MKRLFNIPVVLLSAGTVLLSYPLPQAVAQEKTLKTDPGFGLTWTSKSDTEARGITLSAVPTDNGMEIYTAKNLPKTVSDIEAVYLIFDDRDQLVKVVGSSKAMSNDYYGTETLARINEIAKIIETTYSLKPQKLSHTDKYYGGDDYSFGIYNEKNHYIILFKSEKIIIGLKAISSSISDLKYTIEYEKQPEWGEFLDRQKDDENTAF